MSRGRPHRRFRRHWKMLGLRSTRGHVMFPRERCVQARALANTLLREPLITKQELTSASLRLFLSLSLSLFPLSFCLSFYATRRLPFVSLLRLGYRISYSASDVHGSQLPRYNVRRLLRFYRRACWEHDEARFARRDFRTRSPKCFLRLDERQLRKEFEDFPKFYKSRRRCTVLRGDQVPLGEENRRYWSYWSN